jgi:hypothetical protein
MSVEINTTSGFIQASQNSVVTRHSPENDRAQAEQRRNARVAVSPTSIQPVDNPSVDPVRRAEAVQQLESNNLRIRRDDNSDLTFRARQAVDRFTEINDQQHRQDVSELLGIDIFA